MKTAVLLSGGVDSSVALRLLQQQGHEITAFYIKIWLEDELSFLGTCPWQEDLSYVEQVCAQANVPLEVISLQKEYYDQVVSYTINEVKAGRTPNPDVMCNQRIKFGAFLEVVGSAYDYVATGHYARRIDSPRGILLGLSEDPIKDQTYFLAHTSQEQLSKVLFPIGHLDKKQVRELAQKFNLPNRARKDSQGICFLGKLRFADFLKYHIGEKTGDLIEAETGKIVGKHQGFWYYTIGQRQGIRLGGGPWYVVAKDSKHNHVYISKQYFSADKIRNSFIMRSTKWITTEPVPGKTYQIKVRHGCQFHAGIVTKLDNDRFKVTLEGRDQGIAAGQFAVIYEGLICLGSGIIDEQQTHNQEHLYYR